jgi:hypothetical protein
MKLNTEEINKLAHETLEKHIKDFNKNVWYRLNTLEQDLFIKGFETGYLASTEIQNKEIKMKLKKKKVSKTNG